MYRSQKAFSESANWEFAMHRYPQAIGTDKSRRETDKLAGKTARLFVRGQSKWELEFRKPGEK
jgi:hypothetical protein